MAQKCRVCSHPERVQIESLIVSQLIGKKRIGEQFGISEGSVRGHAERCMGLVQIGRVKEKMEMVHDASLLERTNKRREIIEQQMYEAVEEGDKKEVRESALTAHKFDESEAEWAFRFQEMEDSKEPFTVEVVHVRNANSED